MTLEIHQLSERKETLIERLKKHGINKYPSTHLPYEALESLVEPIEAAKRIAECQI